MLSGENVMFEVGAIMLVAFLGAAIARRAGQSVILGYIVAGILIGPHMHLDLGTVVYGGLLEDIGFIEYMSRLGLILLMFFVGLGFSISKLKRTKGPATILAVMNLGLNMFAGIVLGTALGWPIIDTIFLAGVVSMSSSAVTAKSLMELKRLANPETEFLLGMVIVENFLAMVLLTIMGGLVVKTGTTADSLGTLALGIIAFYLFFIVLAVWVIPRVVERLRAIKSDEMFVLFALGIVFLSAAAAELAAVPGIIGAFFIGMVFAETRVTERFEEKLAPFRDAFVAIFFVTFGMLIDPSMFSQVVGLVVIAVILVIINDVLITASLAFFIGFSPQGAVSMGTSLCGRGAESIMYASVGSRAVGSTRGAELYPFAGAFCFVMSAITPFLMKRSLTITRALSRLLPPYLRFSGGVISRSVSKLVMPSSLSLYHRPRKLGMALVVYFLIICGVVATGGVHHVITAGIGLLVTFSFLALIYGELDPVVLHTNYSSIGVAPGSRGHLSRFVSGFIFLTLLSILGIAFLLPYSWVLSVVVALAYLSISVLMMRDNYYRTFHHGGEVTVAKDLLPWERGDLPYRNRRRWRDL
ncbi:MAG: cation:proton antiporter [Methanomassiliicoccales archaeon]